LNIRLLKKRRDPPPHLALRAARIAFGVLVLIAGIIMLFTPGQGLLTILAALGILSADVPLARRALIRLRIAGRRAKRKYLAARARRQEKKERGRTSSGKKGGKGR
jgi:uncharacterized protein (TIGR02611 family)